MDHVPGSSTTTSTTDPETFVQDFYRKRELTYCLLSLTVNSLLPIFWYFIDFDLVEYVQQNEELPLDALVYIGVMELVKVILVMIVYPVSTVSTQSLRERRKVSVELGESYSYEYESFNSCEDEKFLEIPKYDNVKIWESDDDLLFGRRSFDEQDDQDADELTLVFPNEKPERRTADTLSFLKKVLEIIKGVLCILVSVGATHVLVILFGAPVLADKLLTLQFSIMIVTWLFVPLCMHVSPTSVIFEVLFMRFWDTSIEWVHQSQLRFITTLFGAWCGAIAFPLDWDRPWQRWPVPCVVSLYIFYTAFHLFTILYLIWLMYIWRVKRFLTFRDLNKVKIY